MKIVSINYFAEVVDQEGLRIYKESEAYAKDVEAAKGDWAFAQLQDQVESYYTSYIPVAESTDDSIVYDYAIETEYGITLYLRDNNGNIPVVRFKFDNATLSDTDRALAEGEQELARYVIEAEHLDIEVAA
jgi:hypothetical protein